MSVNGSEGDRVTIVEVSPRDGLQNEKVALTTDQKRELIARAAGFGSARTRSCDRSRRHGSQRGVHCTDEFSRRNQGTDIDGGIRIWHDIARTARASEVIPNLTIAVAFGCPFEGEVSVDRLRSVLDGVLEEAPDELSLADTIGVGVPADVRERFSTATKLASPATALRAHFHDTRALGIANALAAVESGVRILDASLGGIGGCPFAPNATGNIATDDLAYALERSGFQHGLDAHALHDAGVWLEGLFGRRLSASVLHAGGFPVSAPGVES